MIVGLFAACVVDSTTIAQFALNGLVPIEGMVISLNYISKITSFTLPGAALQNIIFKNYGWTDFSTIVGFFIQFVWILLAIILAFFILNFKKFRH